MVRWRAAVVAVLLVGGVARAEAQRLPGGVMPEHYSLTITPDLAKARFAGSETIAVVLAAPTNVITLNAAEIEFGAVKAESREQGTVTPASQDRSPGAPTGNSRRRWGQKQIPPLRCGMTSKISCGMTNKNSCGMTNKNRRRIRGFFAPLRMTTLYAMTTLLRMTTRWAAVRRRRR